VNGTETFVQMYSKWNAIVGNLLAGEDPNILLRVVELASTDGGISQRALQQDLKINQPRLSKLTKKLVSARWVGVRKSPSDRRVLLMRATDNAKTRVERLRMELSAIVVVPAGVAPKRRTAHKLPKNQDSLL
jgi:DNA-binding MarR family transcriptional regulator